MNNTVASGLMREGHPRELQNIEKFVKIDLYNMYLLLLLLSWTEQKNVRSSNVLLYECMYLMFII